LLDHVVVLLVLVIRPVGLDDAIDAVDNARNAIRGDEVLEVAVYRCELATLVEPDPK